MLVEKYLIPNIGGIRLQALTPGHLNQLYRDLLASGRTEREGGLSARTVRYCHTVLRRALEDGVRWGQLTRNVAALADPPRKSATKPKQMTTWTAEELRRFLTHVQDDRLFAAYRLLAATGMRRGEALGLRWADLDLDAARLSVVQTLISVDYSAEFSVPKTNAGRRVVALDGATVSALRAHRDRQEVERLGSVSTRKESWSSASWTAPRSTLTSSVRHSSSGRRRRSCRRSASTTSGTATRASRSRRASTRRSLARGWATARSASRSIPTATRSLRCRRRRRWSRRSSLTRSPFLKLLWLLLNRRNSWADLSPLVVDDT